MSEDTHNHEPIITGIDVHGIQDEYVVGIDAHGDQISMGSSYPPAPPYSPNAVTVTEHGIRYDLVVVRQTKDDDEVDEDEWMVKFGARPIAGVELHQSFEHPTCLTCGQPQGYPVQIYKNKALELDGCIVCMSWAAVGHR